MMTRPKPFRRNESRNTQSVVHTYGDNKTKPLESVTEGQRIEVRVPESDWQNGVRDLATEIQTQVKVKESAAEYRKRVGGVSKIRMGIK